MVGTGLVDPGRGPVEQVLARESRVLQDFRLQGRDELSRHSVLILVLVEVLRHTLLKSLRPDVVPEGLDEAGALLIAYFVENVDGVDCMLDLDLYGMCEGPLHVQVKCAVDELGLHCFGVAVEVSLGVTHAQLIFAVDQTHQSHEVGKGLLQPHVVPPLHSDQIAEPHVSELVKGDVHDAEPEIVSHLGLGLQEHVVVSDAAHVLHPADAELRHVYLVVLLEWKLHPKELLVVLDANLSDPDLLICVQVPGLALTGIDLEGWHSAGLMNDVVGEESEVASEDTVYVGGYGGCGLETVQVESVLFGDAEVQEVLSLDRLLVELGAVRDDLALVAACDHVKFEWGPDAWLVEAREPPVAVVGLQVRVDVHLLVLGVDEPVQTRRVAHVRVLELDRHRVVVLGQQVLMRQVDPVLGKV